MFAYAPLSQPIAEASDSASQEQEGTGLSIRARRRPSWRDRNYCTGATQHAEAPAEKQTTPRGSVGLSLEPGSQLLLPFLELLGALLDHLTHTLDLR
jgi:hypothetical protein